MENGVCHECLKEFELKDEYKIRYVQVEEIWECPHCNYPNSRSDCKMY